MKFILPGIIILIALPFHAAEKNRPGDILWRFKVTGKPDLFSGVSIKGPVVKENRIYFTSDDESRIFCLDAVTGRKLWEFSYYVSAQQNWTDHGKDPRRGKGEMMNVPIKKATPLLFSGNRIYFGASTMTAFWGCVFSVDGVTGKQAWRKPAKAEVFKPIFSVFEKKVYYDYGCLDASTGNPVWERDGLFKKNSEYQFGNYIIVSEDRQNLLYASQGSNPPVYCLQNTGLKLLWKMDYIKYIESILPFSDQGNFFIYGEGKTKGTGLFCTDMKTGEPVWDYCTDSKGNKSGRGKISLVPGGSIVNEGRLYIITHSDSSTKERTTLLAINTADGSVVWDVPVKTGISYDVTPITLLEGKLYFMDDRLNLHCHSALTGKELWSLPCGAIKDDENVMACVMQSRPEIAKGRAYISLFTGQGPYILRKEIICVAIDN